MVSILLYFTHKYRKYFPTGDFYIKNVLSTGDFLHFAIVDSTGSYEVVQHLKISKYWIEVLSSVGRFAMI